MVTLIELLLAGWAILIGVWLISLLAAVVAYAWAAVALVVGIPAWAAWSALRRLLRV